MTNPTKQAIADGLLQAMRAEHEGFHFYSMAAANSSDPKGKEVFQQLAQEELNHVNHLKRNYESFQKTGKLDSEAKLGAPIELQGASPIFSESIRSRIKDAHAEMTALSVAIQLELNAKEYYEAQAEKAQDAEVQSFFRELARWEAGHYRALLAQQETLKEDYWSENGFSPF